jgi:hypothetical protein
MSAILEREYFTVSQENKYFTSDNLSKMIGQGSNQWRHAALKEMIDNALDAAESVYPTIAPHIQIEFTETENGLILSVADNGSGIAPEHIPNIFNLTANSSTKLFYRAPTRGAMGNALKTLIGIPVALGEERGRLEIESCGWRHSVQAWPTPAGTIKKDFQQTAIETTGTRFTVNIPGPLECFYWEPARWIITYGLFNPHATLQIRKIDPIWPAHEEIDEGMRAYKDFSDLSLPATVAFPDPWRKFLPTDPTPAHWYSVAEFKTLVYAKADRNPNQTIGNFIQEFKNLSRVWRKVSKAVAVKTLGELINTPDQIHELHRALLDTTTPPKPEVLGRVGPAHFRQRFDDHFTIVQDAKGKDRYWYRHQWGIVDERPYLVEVAIAQTEQPGDIFYGLNYSVPFADPLAGTHMICTNQDEAIEGQGLAGFLRDAGVYCGTRYGKAQNITAAVHIVMPLLPTLDLGKTRLAIPPALTTIIAATLARAAQVLHKESVDARLRQRKREQRTSEATLDAIRAAQKEQAREQRQIEAEQDKEERQRQRQENQEKRAKEAEERRLRGLLPTQKDVVFELMLPMYMASTEQEATYMGSCGRTPKFDKSEQIVDFLIH